MNALTHAQRPVAVLLAVTGLSSCTDFVPRHDYPQEYPAAAQTGACPDLSGTFENAGTRLHKTSAPSDSILLSSLVLAPGVIASSAQVRSLKIFGPAQDLLQIEALTAEGAVAHSSLPIAPKADGFVHSKPLSAFACDVYQGGSNVIVTNEPVTLDGTTYEVAVRVYRAKDGSLVVAREEIHTDFLGELSIWRKWFRFPQVPGKP